MHYHLRISFRLLNSYKVFLKHFKFCVINYQRESRRKCRSTCLFIVCTYLLTFPFIVQYAYITCYIADTYLFIENCRAIFKRFEKCLYKL